MIKVTENVYVETTTVAHGNVGFVTTRDGVVVIDTPMRPPEAIRLRDEVSKNGEIRYVINQENHADHYAGSYFFPGILITHQETRNKLAKVPTSEIVGIISQLDPNSRQLMKGYEVRLADITFDKSLNLYLGEHTFQLFYLPGHCIGGIGVYIPEEGVVFTADVVVHKMKSVLHESEPSKWLESLRKLEELDVDVIVPGHGSICQKNYLSEQTNIIRRWVEVVQSAIQKGLSEEEAAAKIISPDPYCMPPNGPMPEDQENRAIVARLYYIYSNMVHG